MKGDTAIAYLASYRHVHASNFPECTMYKHGQYVQVTSAHNDIRIDYVLGIYIT